MVNIQRIEMIKTAIGVNKTVYDLRLDFDNDRHANVRIKDSSPQSVVDALMQAARIVEIDISKGEL